MRKKGKNFDTKSNTKKKMKANYKDEKHKK